MVRIWWTSLRIGLVAVLAILMLGCRAQAEYVDHLGCNPDSTAEITLEQRISRLQLPADAPFRVVAAQPPMSCAQVGEVFTPTRIRVLAMIDDDRFLVRDVDAEENTGVFVFDMNAPEELTELFVHERDHDSSVIMPDGRVASVSRGNDVVVAHVDGSGTPVVLDTRNPPYDISGLNDGRVAVLGQRGLTILDPAGDFERQQFPEHSVGIHLTTLRDGRLVSTGLEQIEVWDPAGVEPTIEITASSRMGKIIELSDGRIAGATSESEIWVWDLQDPTKPVEVTRLHGRPARRGQVHGISSLAAMDDGRIVAVGGDLAITIWDPATLERQVIGMHDRNVMWVGVRTDGKIVSAGFDRFRIWDPAVAPRIASRHEDVLLAADELATGEIVTVSRDLEVKVWDRASDGEPTAVSTDQLDYSPHSVRALPDGRVVGASVAALTVWEPPNWRPRVVENDLIIGRIEVLKDGRVAMSTSGETVEVIDVDTGVKTAVGEPDDLFRAVGGLDDGRLVLTSANGDDEIVSTWDPATEQVTVVGEVVAGTRLLVDGNSVLLLLPDGAVKRLVPGKGTSPTALRGPEGALLFVPAGDAATIASVFGVNGGDAELVVTGDTEWRHPLPIPRVLVELEDNQVLVGYGAGWFIAQFD